MTDCKRASPRPAACCIPSAIWVRPGSAKSISVSPALLLHVALLSIAQVFRQWSLSGPRPWPEALRQALDGALTTALRTAAPAPGQRAQVTALVGLRRRDPGHRRADARGDRHDHRGKQAREGAG